MVANRWKLVGCLISAVFLQGCVSTQYTLVSPGVVALNSLTVVAADANWNVAPGVLTAYLHKGSQMWTRDGLLLDRLILIDGVTNGQAIFKSNNSAIVYAEYRNGMLPNEIAELTASSLTTHFGAGTLVESSGLRPTELMGQQAAMFDVTIRGTDTPVRKGRVITFVDNNRLFLMMYIATEIYYFDKHWDSALRVMESASVISAT